MNWFSSDLTSSYGQAITISINTTIIRTNTTPHGITGYWLSRGLHGGNGSDLDRLCCLHNVSFKLRIFLSHHLLTLRILLCRMYLSHSCAIFGCYQHIHHKKITVDYPKASPPSPRGNVEISPPLYACSTNRPATHPLVHHQALDPSIKPTIFVPRHLKAQASTSKHTFIAVHPQQEDLHTGRKGVFLIAVWQYFYFKRCIQNGMIAVSIKYVWHGTMTQI